MSDDKNINEHFQTHYEALLKAIEDTVGSRSSISLPNIKLGDLLMFLDNDSDVHISVEPRAPFSCGTSITGTVSYCFRCMRDRPRYLKFPIACISVIDGGKILIQVNEPESTTV